METKKLMNGPDRHDLLNSLVEMRPMEFTLDSEEGIATPITLVVTRLELESGDGKNFLVHWRLPGRSPRDVCFEGYYNTERRTGWLRRSEG